MPHLSNYRDAVTGLPSTSKPGSLPQKASRLAHSIALCLLTLPLLQTPATADEYTKRYDDMTASLTLNGLSDEVGRRVSGTVFEEITRLRQLFDLRTADSELARLNETGSSTSPSADLRALLQSCKKWQQTTNAFSCRLGEALNLWRNAEQSGVLPDRTALRQLARDIHTRPWSIADDSIDLQGTLIEPGALPTGIILDSALATARALAPEASGISLIINGQGIYWGADDSGNPWQIDVNDPAMEPTKNRFHGILDLGTLRDGAYSVAFHSPRPLYWRVGDRRFNRLINPVNAWPATLTRSTVVIASEATSATALAEILAVMPTSDGIELINQLPDVEALVVTESDKIFPSAGWYSLLTADERHQPLWNDDWRFLIEYRIPAHNTAEYRRPYVAMWITDHDRNLVRQLIIHGDSLRWLKEVPMWWRRHGRRDESVIDGLARPTPTPGRHQVAWDGRDDHGLRVAKGNYILHVEVSREHGARELVTLPFVLSDKPFQDKSQGTAELELISVNFGPDASHTAP